MMMMMMIGFIIVHCSLLHVVPLHITTVCYMCFYFNALPSCSLICKRNFYFLVM